MCQRDKPDSTDLPKPDRLASDFTIQLKKLLLTMGQHGVQHLTDVDADLRQTSYLLDEASEKLGSNFLKLHAATTAQHALVIALDDGAPVSAALRAQIEQLQEEASRCANAAVTALQFQDMTNQLIGRVVGHVASLHHVLQEASAAGALLCSPGDGANDCSSNDRATHTLAVLAQFNQILEQRATLLVGVPEKAVAQTHLESGDIELF